jgi:hypothetical protein
MIDRVSVSEPIAAVNVCLAIRISRLLRSIDVIDVIADLFVLRGVPGHIRSDNVLRRER